MGVVLVEFYYSKIANLKYKKDSWGQFQIRGSDSQLQAFW